MPRANKYQQMIYNLLVSNRNPNPPKRIASTDTTTPCSRPRAERIVVKRMLRW